MADKQLAYRRDSDFFADDDPLAELARIVGFESPAAVSTAPTAEKVSTVRKHEPAFDLEDELLREFERYDAPRPVQSRAPEVIEEPVVDIEADGIPLADEDAAFPRDNRFDVEPEFADSLPQAAGDVDFEPRMEISGDLDSTAELPAGDEFSEPALAVADAGEVVADDLALLEDVVPEPSEILHEPVVEKIAVRHDPAMAEINDVRDLMDEVELSIGSAPVIAPPPAGRAPQWSAASIKLPLANFNAPRREPVVPVELKREPELVEPPVEPEPDREPVQASIAPAPAQVEPAQEPEFSSLEDLGFLPEHDRHDVAPQDLNTAELEFPVPEPSGFDLIAATEQGSVPSDAALTEPAYREESAAPVFDIDDLLADVSHYPVPQREDVPPVQAELNEVRAPLSEPEAVIEQAPRPSATPLRESMVSAPVTPAPRQAARSEADLDDPFAGHDFELDLEGIELELADLDFSGPKKSVAQVSQPLPVPPAKANGIAVAAMTQQAPQSAAMPQSQPIDEATPAVALASETDQSMPFDPSLIADPEEHPEAVEDMHVPVLPHVEQEEPAAVAPEYDFDIDAELASLFEPQQPREAAAQPQVALHMADHPAIAAIGAGASGASSRSKPVDDLDEFEKALEEDFKRSVDEPVHRPQNVTRMTLEAASVTAGRRRARSMRGMLAGVALIAIFGFGAYGVYAWMSGGGMPLGEGAGEPRVITADKDPVKVVPDNPGGKTVPNQDKAVYDQVAGAASAQPKQKTLVSSDEEPVDVVQKTLIPETLPDDNDGATGDITSTPVGETEDPRLLPDQNNAETASNDADNGPMVSPRKVRTMVVKADGTLVAREDTAPEADNTADAALANASQAAVASRTSREPATPSAAGAPTAAAFPAADTELASADPSSAPVEQAHPTATPAPAAPPAAAVATADPPVRSVKTTSVSDTAPLPAARPAAKPSSPAPAAPAEVASASPRTQPTEPAPTAPASAAPPVTAAVAPAAAGGYGIQIASLPSEDEAKKSYANLSNRFAGVIGGRGVEIRKADIAGKGTYYRVRIPAGSKDEAAALCERYRQAGGSCLISK